MKILIVSSEVSPYSKTGGLADYAGALSVALKESSGCEVRVISPYYKMVKEGGFEVDKAGAIKGAAGFEDSCPFDLMEAEASGVTFYFIGKDEYYDRDDLYGTRKTDYEDNAKRFGFFCGATLAAMAETGFYPDIIHANDWHTALLPLYKETHFAKGHPLTKNKILFTIHNLVYQGCFAKDTAGEIGLPREVLRPLISGGNIYFIKSGILYSDAVNAVSKKYRDEILTPEYGCGMEDLLAEKKEDLYGILNGADYANWDPSTDRFIAENYDTETLEKKLECKIDLIRHAKLDLPPEAPLIGSVGRLAEQKGIDIVIDSINEIVKQGAGFILLGRGEEKYEDALRKIAGKQPGRVSVSNAFDDKMAHMIEAGADIFIMPSRYEPCGLNQMYSLKYGTVPVVRATGGLDDTVIDYSKDPINGNGFKFKNSQKKDFIEAVKRAIGLFGKKEEWENLQRRGMKLDFSWKRAAGEYTALYEKMLGIRS